MAEEHDDAWRPHRRAPVIVLSLIAAALGVLLVLAVLDASDDADADDAASTTTTTAARTSTTGSVDTTPTTLPEPIPLDAIRASGGGEAPVGSYRIVYAVVENGDPREETWIVQRPYESLVTVVREGQMIDGTATSRNDLWTYLVDREGWFAIQPELHRAARDVRPLAVMPTMLALGYAEEIGTGDYAGRSCRRFRIAEPVATGSISPLGGSEETEVCLDDAGLVLHERWQIAGSVVQERTATSVEVDPPIDPAIFSPAPRIEDVPELEVLLSAVAVPADEETLERLRTDVPIPDTYTYDGAVFRASTSDTGLPNATEIVRFYSDGADLIEHVEVTAPGIVDLSGGGARPIELERFDEAWFDPDFRVSTLRARINDTSFVELRGADPALLLDLLQQITLR